MHFTTFRPSESNKTEPCILNNGWSTGFFKLVRLTIHGDPISAYLFILVLEIVFLQIRKSDTVKGFKVEWSEIKLAAFTDDLTFFLRGVESLKNLVKIFKRL